WCWTFNKHSPRPGFRPRRRPHFAATSNDYRTTDGLSGCRVPALAHARPAPRRGGRSREPASLAVAEDLSQFAREGLGLAGVSKIAAEEAAVVAREHGRLLTEQLGGCER